MNKTLTIATRKSTLARWQANHVKALLEKAHPGLHCELLTLSTTGDERTDVALADIGGKNLFTKSIQEAVQNGLADIAVHSLKDLSVHPTQGLTLCCFTQRADPRDALITQVNKTIDTLAQGACVGTSSPRRIAQLAAYRPDLTTRLLRGNIETRLNKLQAGEYDAIILATAGIARLGRESVITEHLDIAHFIPAIGQGILGIECRSGDTDTQTLLAPLNDTVSKQCALAERAVNTVLNGDCHTPIGAHAYVQGQELILNASLGLNSNQLIHVQEQGPLTAPIALGERAGHALLRNT